VAVPPSAEKKVDVPWASVLLQGQTVRGFMEGNSIPDIFIPQMLDLYAQGRFRSTTSCAYTHSLTSTAQSRINAMELQSSRSSKWLPHDLER
jgi:Zn-dependent alcohol dehydrogenase